MLTDALQESHIEKGSLHLQINETTLNETHFFTSLVQWISWYWKIGISVALFWAWYSSHFCMLSCDDSPLLLPIRSQAGNFLKYPSGIVATWLLPATQQLLTDKCQMCHEHQLKQSHPALPLCSLMNFGINQLQIQLLTSSPGCFHSSPDQPNSHLLMFSLLWLWENRDFNSLLQHHYSPSWG